MGQQILSAASLMPRGAAIGGAEQKARAAAQDFEGVFIQTMVEQMFSGIQGEGPMGAGEAGSAWRGMLIQQYATNISKAGGIGIADNVYREILSLQEKGTR